MASIDLGLSYWLPLTQFAVQATNRDTIVTDESGSRRRRVADVTLVPTVVADPNERMTLVLDVSAFEKISLAINLDDRGVIQSINSESDKDFTPAISLIGKAIALAGAVIAFGFVEAPPVKSPNLEDEWKERHALLSENASALEDKISNYLRTMSDPSTAPEEVARVGAAVEAMQNQLAAISQARRAWIAGQARTAATQLWSLVPDDLVRVQHDTLPSVLTTPDVPSRQKDLANDFGVLVAVVDRERGETAAQPGSSSSGQVDHIFLRRSRAATVGVYLRGEAAWELDENSVRHLDLVDGYSAVDRLSLDGSWLHDKKFELAYHADMSLRSFGVTTSSNTSTVATSFGEILEAAGAARKQLAERPTAAERELEAATLQMDLLKTASEYEILAATRGKSAELAVLEQQKRLREANS